MVFCTYCGQAFTRDEHLERHILTHTNIKPFKCVTCHMSFTRRDLLQRHYNIHAKDQDDIQAWNPKSAERTPIACTNCCKAKTKCDKQFPCSRCTKRNLQCTSRPGRRAGKPKAKVPRPTSDDQQLNVNNDSSLNPQPQQHHLGGEEQQHKQEHQPKATHQAEETVSYCTEENASPAMESVAAKPSSDAGPCDMSPPLLPMVNAFPLTDFGSEATLSKHRDSSGSHYDVPTGNLNPQFMLDWSDFEYAATFPPQPISAGLESVAFSWTQDEILTAAPDLLSTPQNFQGSPHLKRFAPDSESGNVMAEYQHILPRSMSSTYSNASITQDSWPAFRCMPIPPSQLCHNTPKDNLKGLEHILRNFESWNTIKPVWDEDDCFAAGDDCLSVAPLNENTRDRLLVTTQSLLYQALRSHKDDPNNLSSLPDSGIQTPDSGYASSFVILPPTRLLTSFLRSYVKSFEQYYPLTPHGKLDLKELICYGDRGAGLLALLMLAQGASNATSDDVQNEVFASGLTEACRVALFASLEKDITFGDQHVLQAAIVFTVRAAWSGDKWQMDTAINRRGMCFAALRHLGFLDEPYNDIDMIGNQQTDPDDLWRKWAEEESRSRLFYSWVVVDQDLALFYDMVPLCSVPDFGVPMPDSERLWSAKSAAEWWSTLEHSSRRPGSRPYSLRDLFCRFMDNEAIPLSEITPLHLRLLLHPLQSLVCQYNQLLGCFSSSTSNHITHSEPRRFNISRARSRLVEIQLLLGRWFNLAESYLGENGGKTCSMMQANLVVFHLISLNAVTNFLEIERLARCTIKSYHELELCISDVDEAVYHCGQVSRLVRSMPRSSRPPWWAGAIYRILLVLWAYSLMQKKNTLPTKNLDLSSKLSGPFFAIDALTAEHPHIVQYLTKQEGVPCITKGDGSQIALRQVGASSVLRYGIDIIGEGAPSSFSNGIRSKLERLAAVWEHLV